MFNKLVLKSGFCLQGSKSNLWIPRLASKHWGRRSHTDVPQSNESFNLDANPVLWWGKKKKAPSIQSKRRWGVGEELCGTFAKLWHAPPSVSYLWTVKAPENCVGESLRVQLAVIHSWFTVRKRIWTNTFNLPCCIYEDFGYDFFNTSTSLHQPASSWDSTFHSNLLLDERKLYFCAKEKCPPCLQKLPLLMPLHRIGRAAAYCKRLPVAFCVRCVASFPSILLKIVLLKGHSAASVCDFPARIMKPQETRIQSGAKSFRTPTTTSVSLKTHTYVRDIQSAAGVKSLDPWPLFGPMRTSSTGGARQTTAYK